MNEIKRDGGSRFFVEPLRDEYGNTGHPFAVIEASVEVRPEAWGDREVLHVIGPDSHKPWPWHYRDVAGWLETEGPARDLTREEWTEVVANAREAS